MDGNKMPLLAPRMFGFNFPQQEETETRRPSVSCQFMSMKKITFFTFWIEKNKSNGSVTLCLCTTATETSGKVLKSEPFNLFPLQIV